MAFHNMDVSNERKRTVDFLRNMADAIEDGIQIRYGGMEIEPEYEDVFLGELEPIDNRKNGCWRIGFVYMVEDSKIVELLTKERGK